MSSRHVARLKQSGPALLPASDEDDSSEEEIVPKGKPSKPSFAMLAALAASDDDEEELVGVSAPAVLSAQASQSSKSKKRSSKKKKSVKAPMVPPAKVVERETADSLAKAVADELAFVTDSSASQLDFLLCDLRLLNSDSEWRRLFGAEPDAGAEGAAAGGKGRRQAPKHGVAALRRKPKCHLCRVKPAWPAPPAKAGGGLTMRMVPTSGDVREFEYEWSDGYTMFQDMFQQVILSGDPNSLIELWHTQPCHIDTMLQLSEYLRTIGQKESCADLLQRCLFVLESAWHPAFRPWEVQCRLRYESIPNRALFSTLFRHMQLIGRAGCYRTATEVGKLLLHLSPSTDPLRVLLCLDYFAIRCRQYELTVALVGGSSGLPCPPIILPNLNFSFALAKFYLESAATTPPASDSPSASACLVAALASYPYFLRPILTACKISDLTVGIGSTPSSAEGPSVGHCVWSTVLSHPHFALECPENEDLDRLVSVFALRHPGIWKTHAAIVWLYGCCRVVMSIADACASAPSSVCGDLQLGCLPLSTLLSCRDAASYQLAGVSCFGGSPASAAVMYRQAAGLEFTLFGEVTTSASVPQWIIAAGNPSALANYPVDAGTLRSALQHYTNVMVDDFSDELTTMAPELLAGAAGGGDGFDPAAAAGVAAHHIGPPVQPLDAQHGNPLMLLLQSLLPWNVVIPQAGAAPGADGDDGFHEGDYEFDDDE